MSCSIFLSVLYTTHIKRVVNTTQCHYASAEWSVGGGEGPNMSFLGVFTVYLSRGNHMSTFMEPPSLAGYIDCCHN